MAKGVNTTPVAIFDVDGTSRVPISSSTPAGTEMGMYVRVVSQPAAGAGGGPATIVDGGDVTEGATTDAAVTTDSNGTVSGKLRGLVKILADVWDSVNHRVKVDGSGVTQPVSGTFFQATQPVSGTFFQATQPVSLASGQAVDGSDATVGAKADAAVTDSTTTNTHMSFLKGLVKILADVWDSVNHRLNANITNTSLAVTGTFFQTTQPISINQTGTNNDVDVLTIPAITGTVTANAGTNLNTSALALDSTVAKDASLTTLDTDLKAAQPRKIQDSAGGSITVGLKAAAASVPVVIASDQGAVPVSGTFYQATQPVNAVSLPLPANASQETSGNLDILRDTALNLQTALLQQIVTELRVMNVVLAQGLNVKDDLDNMRLDAYYNP